MSFNEILLLLVGGGFFLVMMYMFIRVLFLPNPSAEAKKEHNSAEKKLAPKSGKAA
jgi:hypothetical protein